MHSQRSVFGEILHKLGTVIAAASGQCRVRLYFLPLLTALQGQGWGLTPFKSHLIHLPTPELAQLQTQTVFARGFTST